MTDNVLKKPTGARVGRRTTVLLVLAFGLGAVAGMLTYAASDGRLWGTSSYCVVTQESSAERKLEAGSFVAADSGCLPGEVGPLCGRLETSSRNTVATFESNDCSLFG